MANDQMYTATCKGQSEGGVVVQDRRVQRSCCASALSSLADKLWKTGAACVVMIVVCSSGENAETQQSFQELKQACVDPRGIVTGTSKAHRPQMLPQTPAEGRDH